MKNLFAFLFCTLFAFSKTFAQPDCNMAVPACTTPSFPVEGGSGVGLVNDIPPPGSISNPSSNPAGVNSGCLLAGELNPTFITISVISDGLLEFSMGDGVPTGCMDWAMWQVPAGGTFADGCSGIQGNTLPPAACNWNGMCGGYTGMASTPPTHPVTGVTGSTYDFQPPLTVSAGDQFILCFSNYSGLSTTVPLSFFGTADVSCNTIVVICPGETATLTAPPGGSSYTWTPATTPATGMTVTASPSVPTTYVCNYIDGTGASTSMSFDVIFHTPATPNYSITPEDCAGDNDAQVVMSPVGTGPFTYSLNGTPDADGIFTPLAPGLYLAQVTDANGCVADTIINITAAAPCCTMSLSTSYNPTLCPGSCDGDATVNITGATAFSNINWLNGAGAPIGQTTPTAGSLCAGTYYAEVTDSLCTLYDTVVVTELPGPTISGVNLVQPLCFGNTNGNLTINHTGGTQFSIDGGSTFQSSNVFTNLGSGTYSIEVRNANNCSATTVVTLDEPPLLTITIDSVKQVSCNAGTDGAVYTTITGGTTPYSYNWSNGDTTSALSVIPANFYTGNVTDANGCTASDTATVSEPPAMGMILDIDSISCFNYCDGKVTATINGGTLPYVYNWLGTTSSTTNVASGLCVGGYDLKVTDAMGCAVTQLDFYVPQPMQVQVGTITIKNEKCFASCDGRIVIDSPDGAAYSIDGGNIYLANNTFNNLCADTYEVFVKDSHGCFNSTTVEVFRPAKVDVEFAFGPQPTDIFATEITFNNLSPNATSFTWYIDSLAILHTESPVFTFPPYEPGLYNVCLAAQNDSGCVDSVCHVVVIDDYTYIFLPNSFTPNGDGKNDFFRPVVNNVTADDYVFTIYNRWGGVVFKTTDPNSIGWDGSVNSIKAKEDVYVWKITARSAFTAEKKEWVGHVTLLR